jgi:UDPglucose 6-dehydrogenase
LNPEEVLDERNEPLKVSVVGLGKLGACTAAALASKHINVIGVDVHEKTVDTINAGHAPVSEPWLEETIFMSQGHLRATNDYEDAVCNSDLTLILVPTPSKADGGFSLDYVRTAGKEIAEVLARKSSYHVVVLVSTVLPGDCETEIIPLLEQYSAKRCGPDFGFCYGPEFIALGSVIHDFLNPDFVLIGEYDDRSGDMLSNMYRHSCENDPSIARMNIVNAEITKISVNTYVTTKITFANMLTEVCSRLPGANVDVVTDAMGRDTRIGRRYLTGAVSFGGPCFPRDNVAFAHLAHSIGANGGLAEATHAYNEAHKTWLLDRVLLSCPDPGSLVSVVGLTYRPRTTVLEQAAGMWLVRQLISYGKRVKVFDPHAMSELHTIFGNTVDYAWDLASAVGDADVSVLMTPEDGVPDLRAQDFRGTQTTVFDCWRSCKQSLQGAPGVSYIGLGMGPDVSIAKPASVP